MAAAIISKHPEEFGFTQEEIEAESWAEYELVTVPRATPLSAIAKAAGASEQALLELNPELRRTCTPPRPHAVKVPYGQAGVFAENWPEVEDTVAKLAFAQHRVGRGESLRTVAARYGVDQHTLARMNGVRVGRHVKAGTELVIPLNAASRDQAVAFARAEPPAPAERERRARGASSRREAKVVLARGAPSAGRKAVLASASGTERAAAGRRAATVAGRERATVRVRSGDTLWSISQRFGVAVEELCRWNGIRSPKRFKLMAGKALVVYPRHGEASNAPASTRAAARG